MKIRITKPGLYGSAGAIAVGTEFDVKEEPKGWAGRYDVVSSGGKGKTAVTNPKPTEDAPKGPFEAREKGGGWWAIYSADGKEVGKSMREDDAKAFNDLSDEDKAAFIAED
jgi:hypothetical protein